ncbi:hypothetical protein ATY78_04880 [Rhizobium sp. R635]|nr:hypothetical protein ATY78_04880 [Rhizobium sp. R635]
MLLICFIERFPLPIRLRDDLASLLARKRRGKKARRRLFFAAVNFVFLSLLGDMVVNLVKLLFLVLF